MPNVYDSDFDEHGEQDGFRWRGASLGRKAGAEQLGASIYELPPGETTFPYHYHLANEELLIVLAGTPHLREPGGWRQLREGDLVAFPTGERGAHQLANRTDRPARFLIVSEMRGPEIAVYPDSGKVGAREHAPGTPGPGMRLNFRSSEAVDYWDGERPPEGRD